MNDHAIARFTDEDGDDNELSLEFATATMGHVLLGQGRVEEARAVFVAVLARDPDDAAAREGLGACGPATRTDVPAPQAFVRAIAMSPTAVMVHWGAPVAALAHLAADAQGLPLALAVTTLRAGPTGVISAHRSVPLDGREGEVAVRSLDPSSTHLVTLGARLGDRLVPFVHASVARTPLGPAEVAAEPGPSPSPSPALEEAAPAAPAAMSFAGAYARWMEGVSSS